MVTAAAVRGSLDLEVLLQESQGSNVRTDLTQHTPTHAHAPADVPLCIATFFPPEFTPPPLFTVREIYAPRAPRCAPRAHRAYVSTNPFLHFSHFFRVARTRWPKG